MKAKISFLIAVDLLILAFYLFAQQENINKAETDNAAIYYTKAFELMKYPEAKEVRNKIRQIIENGWQADPEIQGFITDNETSFANFYKGLILPKCDFTFGEKYRYLIQKKIPPFGKIRNLSNLLFLKARYCQKQKDFAQAVDICLFSLSFCRHISFDNTLVSKAMVLAIEKYSYMLLGDYLNSENINKELSQRILNYLEDYEKKHFLVQEIIEPEKESFISAIQLVADNPNEMKDINGEEPSQEVKQKFKLFGNKAIEHARELTNKYFGYLIKAAETNKENDWEFAINEWNKFIEEVQNTKPQLSDAFLGKREFDEIYANKTVDILFALIPFMSYKEIVQRYYSNSGQLKELELSAKMKSG